MKGQTIKTIGKLSTVFFILLVLYMISLFFAFLIPDSWIQDYENQGVTYIQETEGAYPVYFFGEDSGKLDNFTDNLMLESTLKDNNLSTLENSMSVKEYPRYWHGYQVILRPLLTSFTYIEIRQMMTFLFWGLIFLTGYFLAKRTWFLYGVLWIAGMVEVRASIISVSLQFSGIFFITLLSVLWMLLRTKWTKENLLLTFFVIGSITNFFDLLTAPLVTFGVPLGVITLLCLVENREERGTLSFFVGQLLKMAGAGIAWAAGYGLTWFSKWLIASGILKENVVKNALEAGTFRVSGSEEYPLNRSLMLQSNFNDFFSQKECKLLIAGIILGILIVFFFKGFKGFQEGKKGLLFLPIGVLPYIWYELLANHSQIHHFFTYRNQLITFFALGFFFLFFIDFPGLQKNFEKIKKEKLSFKR